MRSNMNNLYSLALVLDDGHVRGSAWRAVVAGAADGSPVKKQEAAAVGSAQVRWRGGRRGGGGELAKR